MLADMRPCFFCRLEILQIAVQRLTFCLTFNLHTNIFISRFGWQVKKWWDAAFAGAAAAAEGIARNFAGGNLSSGVLFKAGFVVVTLYI